MPKRLLPALIAAALLLAGCGASGGDAATTSRSGGQEPASTTTADAGGDDGGDDETTTTGEDDGGGKELTSDDLEAILPTAADIGPDYEVKEDDDDVYESTTTTAPGEEDPTEAALREACPKAAELDLMSDEANEDEVGVEFATEDDRGIEVTLDPTPVGIDDDTIDDIVEAFNDCGVVEFEDPDSGSMTMELSAERLDGVGDFGIEIRLDTALTLFGVPITIGFHGYLFDVDGVGVSVTSSDGLDPGTFESVEGDDDLLPGLAAEMEQRVEALTD